jgi:hypothetical protein
MPVILVQVERQTSLANPALFQLKAPHPFKHEAPTLITRIGAHIRKVPSIENGGEKSGTRRTGMEMGVRSSGLAVS